MKWAELEHNQELLDTMAEEVEKKVQDGQEPVSARIEVLKAHDIEFDEDAMRAAAVDKMELDLESLNNVSGGKKAYFCWTDYSCYMAVMHDDNDSNFHACFNDYYCIFVNQCSVNDLSYREWEKKNR